MPIPWHNNVKCDCVSSNQEYSETELKVSRRRDTTLRMHEMASMRCSRRLQSCANPRGCMAKFQGVLVSQRAKGLREGLLSSNLSIYPFLDKTSKCIGMLFVGISREVALFFLLKSTDGLQVNQRFCVARTFDIIKRTNPSCTSPSVLGRRDAGVAVTSMQGAGP